MDLYFITGNKDKLAQAQSVLPQIKQLDIDLPEIQEIDAKKIIEAKLEAALHHVKDNVIVEDTSIYFDCLNGLPGPLIKWFMKTIGNEGLFKIVSLLGNDNAQVKSVVGYAKNVQEIYFFEGVISGSIVQPRGEHGFGWDPIFLPDGNSKTFAEMSFEEKNQFSMRKLALDRLKDFLNKAN